MHESIATALYRGYERKVATFDWDRFRQRISQLPNKRAAWMRGALREMQRLPHVVAFKPKILGQGRRAEAHVIGVSHETDYFDRSGWYGFGVRFTARDFGVDFIDLPVLVTHHLVQRTMQRLDVANPQVAINSLQQAIYCALWLETPRSDSMLLPAKGGAVIAVPDRDYPELWALITFIDDSKLSDVQRQQIAFWSGKVGQSILSFYEQERVKPPADRNPFAMEMMRTGLYA